MVCSGRRGLGVRQALKDSDSERGLSARRRDSARGSVGPITGSSTTATRRCSSRRSRRLTAGALMPSRAPIRARSQPRSCRRAHASSRRDRRLGAIPSNATSSRSLVFTEVSIICIKIYKSVAKPRGVRRLQSCSHFVSPIDSRSRVELGCFNPGGDAGSTWIRTGERGDSPQRRRER